MMTDVQAMREDLTNSLRAKVGKAGRSKCD